MAPKEKDKICLDAGDWIEVQEARSIAEVPTLYGRVCARGDEVTNIRERYDKFDALKKVTVTNDLTAKQRAENEAYFEARRNAEPYPPAPNWPHPANTTYVNRHEFDAYMKWKDDEDFRIRVEKIVEAMDNDKPRETAGGGIRVPVLAAGLMSIAFAVVFALALVVF